MLIGVKMKEVELILRETGREYKVNQLNEVDRAVKFCYEYIGKKNTEHFAVINLNLHLDPINVILINIGSISEAKIDISQIVKGALLTNASGVIIAHNHPASDASPSLADDLLTDRVKDSLHLFHITLIDHVIVTPAREEYYSYKENGKIETEK